MKNIKTFHLVCRIVLIILIVKLPANFVTNTFAQYPLETVKNVADKIIKETSFEFEMVEQKNVLGIQVIDFQHIFGRETKGVGYALSYIKTKEEAPALFGLSTKNAIKIWLNDSVVFQKSSSQDLQLKEISYNRFVFQDTLKLTLKKGLNKILVKVASEPDQWNFFLRAINEDGDENKTIKYTLSSMTLELKQNNWLCIGSFPNKDFNKIYPPEKEIKKYYHYQKKIYTWKPPPKNMLLELKIEPTTSFHKDSYLEWHYATGETMLGMLTVADVTGEKKHRNFVRRFCEFTLQHLKLSDYLYNTQHAFRCMNHRFFRRTMLDDTGAPALPFAEFYMRNKKNKYWQIIEPIADYVSNEQMRLEDSTLCRPEPVPSTIWADDLFMSVPFLLRMAKITGNQNYYDDVTHQVIKFYEYLFDKGKGLMKHGWFNQTGQTSIAFWGRANGWTIWATSEALMYLPKEHPRYHKILKYFQQHVEGLAKHQGKSGMWHQVLNFPESYTESSCTAMFILGMARGVRLGWLEKKYQDNTLKGWEALTKKIDEDGTVHSICRGTGIGESLEFYFNRPTFDHDPRGLGAVLTAGIEIYKMQNQ